MYKGSLYLGTAVVCINNGNNNINSNGRAPSCTIHARHRLVRSDISYVSVGVFVCVAIDRVTTDSFGT